MNAWYAHYPGDYLRDTAHLSLIEHGAYRLLLDHYYSTGSPLPASKDALYRICGAFTDAERAAVDSILAQFFKVRADGYRNARADREILKRSEQKKRLSEAGRRGGKSRGVLNFQARLKPGLSKPQPQPHKEAAAAPLFTPEESVWGFLVIKPCGPVSFRTLLESRWSSRNGDRPSVLIGETVDVWEAAAGRRLRRTPQLFRALADLRRKEQASREQASGGRALPIRVLTAEEIPA
jgi:uncharacterized protein YdaU (DUF1376 family)